MEDDEDEDEEDGEVEEVEGDFLRGRLAVCAAVCDLRRGSVLRLEGLTASAPRTGRDSGESLGSLEEVEGDPDEEDDIADEEEDEVLDEDEDDDEDELDAEEIEGVLLLIV